MANNIYWFNLLPVILFFTYLAFFYLDIFLLSIIALVPLSIPLRDMAPNLGFDLSLPAEPLIIAAMFIVLLKFLSDWNFDKKILNSSCYDCHFT